MAKKGTSKAHHHSALISGNVVAWARKRLGKSHEQIAEEIGTTVKAEDIAQWEDDKNPPDFRRAQKLAVALHIPFGYLFLSNPPKNDIKVPDLRTVGSKQITEFSPNLLDQLRSLLPQAGMISGVRSRRGPQGAFEVSHAMRDVCTSPPSPKCER